MDTVNEKIKGMFANAKVQVDSLEKKASQSFTDLGSRTRESFEHAPDQLRRSWAALVQAIRRELGFATRDDLQEINARLDELSAKLDRVLHAQKPRSGHKERSTE